MENSKIISKEYYRNHLLSFTEQAMPGYPVSINEHCPEHAPESMCIGEVFHDNERIAYCESTDKDSARQYCRQIVDTQIAHTSAVKPAMQPGITDLAPALTAIREQLDSRLHGILLAHWHNDNKALSINALKQAGMYESTTAVYLAYAELARLLCDALNYIPMPPRNGQDPYLSLIIETVEPELHTSDSLALRLKPAIYQALESFFSA